MLNLRKNAQRLWLGVLASVLLLAGSSAQAQIADGLVAYWNFDTESYIDLIGGFDGTPEGTVPIPFVDGQAGFGKAIQLNGEDQEVTITGGEPDDLAFAGGSITVAGWFKVDAFDTGWQALIAKGEGTNWRVARRDPTDFMTASMGIGEAPQGGPAVNDGQWHHIAAIADNTDPGGMFIYIDGVLAETTAPALPVLAANGLRVKIGENPGALGREWEGEIDDMAIWSRPLTADEVTLLANAPLSSLLGGADFIIVRSAAANAVGFTVQAIDIGAAQVNPATVTVTLDGVSVPATVSKVGQTTTISYSIFADQNLFFASGSQHALVINLNDTQGNPVVSEQTFTVASYATIPASYALAAPPTVPGMVVSRVFQTATARTPSAAANNTASADQQLLGGMVDLAGTVLPNIAENAGPINISGDSDGGLYWTANANWEQRGGDINPNPPQPDNFNSSEPAGSAGLFANEYPPGPLLSEDPNNYVLETFAYVQLTRGLHRWGVNSDEGFKVTAAPGQPSVLGVTLGELNGGRTAADTLFDFVAEADGYYPIRLLSWEGSGAASCEWFSVNIDTGERFLIGDVTSPGSYDAFRTGQGRARLHSILPAPGYTGVVPQPTIRIEIANGRTSLVAGSAKLALDGVAVTPTVNGTVITYAVPTQLARDSTHTVEFIWDENTTPVTSWTNSWSFTVASFTPDTFPPAPDSFWIEAEDFDYQRGQTVAAASTMPYRGGAYQGLIAVLNVDYFDTETSFPFDDAGTSYRGASRTDPATMIMSTLSAINGGEQFATNRPGGIQMTSNYKIGWVGGDNWWNYTRTIPAGTYRAYSATSQGTPTDIVRSTLYWVTAGVGQTNAQQQLQTLGVFRSIGSPGWSQNILCPLRTADAADAPLAAFKLPGGPVTLRWQGLGGDHDWMVFVKDNSVPASFKSLAPAEGSIQYRNVQIQAVLEDFGTKVNQSTIKLLVNGVDVTAQATISKVGDLTTVAYDPGLLAADATHTYTVEFKDDGTPVKTTVSTGTFTTHLFPGVPAGTFAVEAEDFDHSGGQVVAAANTMPYVGGAYDQLVPLLGIDYQDNGNDTDAGIVNYRTDLRPNNPNMNVNLGARLGSDRGNWTVTTSYKIGWTGTGDWYNYTRTMPAGAYEVYLAISQDSATTGNTNSRASMDRVMTGVGTTNQTLQALGVFRAPGSGGWGPNRLVPLTAAVDNPQKVVVSVSGTATFRLNADSGDLDYLLFLPTGATPQPEISSIVINPNGSITVTWTGSAVLESAPSVTGPWTEVAGATSPATFEPTQAQLFGRLRQP